MAKKLDELQKIGDDIVAKFKKGENGAVLFMATDEQDQVTMYRGSGAVIGSTLVTSMIEDEELAQWIISAVELYLSQKMLVDKLNQSVN